MKLKFASFISLIGHPLLTMSIFAIISFFVHEAFRPAFMHSCIVIIGIIMPLCLKMYISSKNGTYTNFDVSDKAQRQSWYPFAIGILLIITIILFVTDQPHPFRVSVLSAFLLLLVSQVTNYFVKSSLHVSFSVLLAFLILPSSFMLGILFLFFAFLIGWSRYTVKRHSLTEIIIGSIIGFTIGSISLFIL